MKKEKIKQISVLCLDGKQMFANISDIECPKRTIFRQISNELILGIDPNDPEHQQLFLVNAKKIYCPTGVLTFRPTEKYNECSYKSYFND
ncbi:MAG: hypothetical protein WC523_02775 [Patescibacteria group bacterium]